MEAKESMTAGVTVIGAEAPSNYHVASRGEAPSQPPNQLAISPTGAVTPGSAGIPGLVDKKKRGRPRKYGPDGSVSRSYSPKMTSASAPTSGGSQPSGKRGRGRSAASEAKQQPRFEMVSMGDGFGRSDGANFTPHVITVNVGEDVTAKIISFCQQGPRAICILSANGMVSNATLRQSDSSGGTLTYEGRFEIVNLCGSFTPTEREGTRYRAGGLSVSLSSPNGQVVGGCVAGLLIAASPVQVIVGSFLPTNPPELKPKKPKVQVQTPSAPTPFTITTALPPPNVAEKDSCNGQGHNHNNSVAPMQNLTSIASYPRENWPNTHSMQERRTSPTDINISLPGGM
ncbi:AT-hook motif nuclear-localized protein 7-like isoform X1 [Chenopodium quinoa]|uniref:AT-hook motif nuclear-localized protein n=2 Tax=Chenopodium quinoa TaxID=63459 RepID=A0A803LI34_CHEQI|nr:AT-hook motif nuclear-localized protein 7-like isoform X1 [Chenopodium quinoa]XP_021756257.1 AT-hook motif nuclear-localized protein 7-like isoform X1 [Chenopodium quinoa]